MEGLDYCELWDASDDYNGHAAAPDDSPLPRPVRWRRRRRPAVASSNPALGRPFWARRRWGRLGRRATFCLLYPGRAACPCTNELYQINKALTKFNEALTKPYHGLIKDLL